MTSKRKYFNIKCKLYHMLEFEMKRSRNLFDEKTKVELLLSLSLSDQILQLTNRETSGKEDRIKYLR